MTYSLSADELVRWLCKAVCRPITNHLATVFWLLSGMASCFISGMAITNDLPSVFCWVSQMARCHISSFISKSPAMYKKTQRPFAVMLRQAQHRVRRAYRTAFSHHKSSSVQFFSNDLPQTFTRYRCI